ncbi:MAG: RHS repeat-associated core domain-containing protein, partial [Desulfatiglandales bacterium]
FTYDPVGNRITSADTTAEWTYNPNNELQAYNGVSFQYDPNGNTIQKTEESEVIHYIYNEEDRLIRVEDNTNNVIAEYYYDPFGRRLWKEIDGERTWFLYSDEGLVAEMDASGNVIKSYGWQPGATWTTDPLFMMKDGQYYFYHNDHLGTPQKMTSASGEVVWSAKYEAFGRAQVEIETVVNNLRFPGQYYDVDAELHYNYWRYYDPNIGRYLLPDPIGLDGGINFYSYADNNPIVLFDSRGLACGSWWNDWAITDKPDGYDFAKCCQDHDDCYVGKYNQCFKGKGTCDEEFYECMERYCRLKHLGDNRCLHYAAKYWNAVVSYDPAFWAFYQARKKPPCNQCYE